MKRCTYPYCGADRSECSMCNSSLRKATGPLLLAFAFGLAFAVAVFIDWVTS